MPIEIRKRDALPHLEETSPRSAFAVFAVVYDQSAMHGSRSSRHAAPASAAFNGMILTIAPCSVHCTNDAGKHFLLRSTTLAGTAPSARD